MCWKLILEEFGTNIHHISGVDNIVADTLSRLMSTTFNQDKPRTSRSLSSVNELFTAVVE